MVSPLQYQQPLNSGFGDFFRIKTKTKQQKTTTYFSTESKKQN